MIRLPVRCEQDTASSIVIRDDASREVAHLIGEGSHISHVMWEDAKQIVRALNAGLAKQENSKKVKAHLAVAASDKTLEAARRHGSKF